jgi:hypothetical protein
MSSKFALTMPGNQNARSMAGENNKAGYFQCRWYNKQVGEVTEWFMVPLSKIAVRCSK